MDVFVEAVLVTHLGMHLLCSFHRSRGCGQDFLMEWMEEYYKKMFSSLLNVLHCHRIFQFLRFFPSNLPARDEVGHPHSLRYSSLLFFDLTLILKCGEQSYPKALSIGSDTALQPWIVRFVSEISFCSLKITRLNMMGSCLQTNSLRSGYDYLLISQLSGVQYETLLIRFF